MGLGPKTSYHVQELGAPALWDGLGPLGWSGLLDNTERLYTTEGFEAQASKHIL